MEDGDVILLATDGVFDNVPDGLLITEMRKVQGERDPTKIQGVANSIAWMARSLAFDGAFMSPFAQSARENGIDTIGTCIGSVLTLKSIGRIPFGRLQYTGLIKHIYI